MMLRDEAMGQRSPSSVRCAAVSRILSLNAALNRPPGRVADTPVSYDCNSWGTETTGHPRSASYTKLRGDRCVTHIGREGPLEMLPGSNVRKFVAPPAPRSTVRCAVILGHSARDC